MFNILIVEDEETISHLIEFNLNKEGFKTVIADDANYAMLLLKDFIPNVIILDLMLPGLQGEDFLKLLKSKNEYKDIAVIILSAKSQESIITKLLADGADDYIVKPFSVKVLIAKIKALLRRIEKKDNKLIFNGIELDLNTFSAYLDNKILDLTTKEFELLRLFLSNPNKIFSREELFTKVWGYDSQVQTRTVDVHISSLRKKLGTKADIIKSKPKVGYGLIL
ncbi:MAG: winged helix-turn-helix domain-containing protein [Desulfurella sp.]|jgi:two-component system phosphate regulon response regulator PhoB|uniref:Two-component system, OmpR family, phosphate regulon response regulator PhoB n=1 Tax=Desulfurella multipotens TaxID=79269 RepID=A0A1G6PT08_9BACT|nr:MULTISPECIES: winged helix-turn-helix domain-containing protein [Desulfurella]AHF97089.1 OmpR family, response regulator [Desulfurella acetivorans A63]PMP63180.1 MAG: DNA-binding response regulator [Desulfurella multipotens]PMP91698.1 MAG: DNA-binding response regulator [Desulfurella sp.]SDC83101.1 two-component system, OmpR family, phosphate regulon response regulator PhoB [Desulfurella multipotens]